MSPTEYAKYLKEEQAAVTAAKSDAEKSRLQATALGEKISLLDGILQSRALDSVVGPTFLSRAASGVTGVLGRFATGFAASAPVGAVAGAPFAGVGAVPGALISGTAGGLALASQGALDVFGERQNFIASVEQFVSKEFLDNLINVKAQGATFGALQKAEQDALTQAASKIGTWRVTSGTGDERKVVGYNASEEDFRRELATIQRLARVAYERASGNSITPTERSVLDQFFPTTTMISGYNFFQ
jgi:hypothetical protein